MSAADAGSTRPLLALIAWAMCAPALGPYLLLAYDALSDPVRPSAAPAPTLFLASHPCAGLAAGGLAWVLLAWMTLRWVRDRPLHWSAPLLCIALGLLALAAFGGVAPIAAMFAWPALVFACFLSYWHLRARRAARADA